MNPHHVKWIVTRQSVFTHDLMSCTTVSEGAELFVLSSHTPNTPSYCPGDSITSTISRKILESELGLFSLYIYILSVEIVRSVFFLSQSCLFTSCVSFISSGGSGAAGAWLNNNQLYKFSYTTEVLVGKAKGSKQSNSGYRISSDVGVNLAWRDPGSKDDQLIQIAVSCS